MSNSLNVMNKVFLIIGLTKESRHWDNDFVDNLKLLFKVDEVIGIDLPGSGILSEKQSPLSMKEIVKISRDSIESKLGGDNNLLISISLGGMVATEWIKLYPKDFQKLVIINSSFKNFSPVYKRVQPYAIREFLRVFKERDLKQRESLALSLCSNNPAPFDKTLEKWHQIAIDKPMRRSDMLKQTIAGARFSLNFTPSIPALIIASRHDRLAHFSCSENIQKSWKKDYFLFEDEKVGHAAHVDAPKELATKIYQWSQNAR